MSEIPLVAVIDGDDSVRWAVAELIRTEGLGAQVYASAEEFILSDQMPFTACLVLDVQLPGMSGLQLQSHLAASGRYIPIIFITASSDPTARALAIEVGAVNVLDKAVGAKALLREIRLILKARHDEGPCLHSPEKSRP